jgi:diguanylate cyclase (GGDEF)-like protein
VAVHGRWRGEVWNRHASGSLYAAMLTVTAVRDTAGLLSHYVGILSDITALKEHAEELERLARFDDLTGVANRRLLTERLHAALTRADQADGQVVIAYLDLDGFKQVNDERGHEAGDQVLVEYSRRLRACVRECDTVARLGGDEFVIVLCHVQHDDDWLPVVRRLLETASAPFADAGQPLHLTVSIGVTRYPADRADADTLLRHADHAMYEAKRTGKNRYELFNADSERESMALHDFGSAVRKGVREGEFVLHFQPQVNLRTGQLVGVEALVRWQHPEHGLLMPGSFAESSELIEIDRWVLDTRWPRWRSGLPPGRPADEREPLGPARAESGFIPELWEVLARYLHRATRLELELLGRQHGRLHGRLAEDGGLPRAGRALCHRRLRHRLLVADLCPAPACFHAQDRPVLRPRHARGCRRSRHRAGRDRAGPVLPA